MDNLENPAGGVNHTHMLAIPKVSETCVAPVVGMRRNADVTPHNAEEVGVDIVQLLQSVTNASTTRGVLADLNRVIRELQQQLYAQPKDLLLAEAIRRLCTARGCLETAVQKQSTNKHAEPDSGALQTGDQVKAIRHGDGVMLSAHH